MIWGTNKNRPCPPHYRDFLNTFRWHKKISSLLILFRGGRVLKNEMDRVGTKHVSKTSNLPPKLHAQSSSSCKLNTGHWSYFAVKCWRLYVWFSSWSLISQNMGGVATVLRNDEKLSAIKVDEGLDKDEFFSLDMVSLVRQLIYWIFTVR